MCVWLCVCVCGYVRAIFGRPCASAILFVWSRDPSWANPGGPGCTHVITTTLTSPLTSPVNKKNECGECPLYYYCVRRMATGGDHERTRVTLLQGEANWASWKVQMRHQLRSRKLWKLVKGEETMAEGAERPAVEAF